MHILDKADSERIYHHAMRVEGENICQGCLPGNDPKAAKKAEFLNGINALCPVLACATNTQVENRVMRVT
jgi:hypothetical protein